MADQNAQSSSSSASAKTSQHPTGYAPGDYDEVTEASIAEALQREGLRREDVEIGMIWAQTTDGIIGDGKEMPWYLPEDLQHFKNATVDHAVVMGRTSWEALGERYRPLPQRENYVVTRNASYEAPGGHVFSSLPDAIASAAAFQLGNDETRPALVWILGGGQVYAQCMPVADRIVITEIAMTAPERFQVYAPHVSEPEFTLTASEWKVSEKGHTVDGEENLEFRICEWTRG